MRICAQVTRERVPQAWGWIWIGILKFFYSVVSSACRMYSTKRYDLSKKKKKKEEKKVTRKFDLPERRHMLQKQLQLWQAVNKSSLDHLLSICPTNRPQQHHHPRQTFRLFVSPVMPYLRHQLHTPEDRADGAEDVGGKRNIRLGSHDEESFKKVVDVIEKKNKKKQ